MNPIIRSKEIKMVKLSDIKLNPKNRNKHPAEQIERIVDIIKYQGFRRPGTISNRSGLLVCGEGRYLAAKKMGLKEMPVMYQDYESEEQEYADGIADNALDKWAELDSINIKNDIANFSDSFDIELLGLKDFEIDLGKLEELAKAEEDELYTKKIEAPIYGPKGKKPQLSELYNQSKTDELIKDIEKAKIPEQVKTFLRIAAARHTVFSYENIAEYYAHSSPEVQDLMEKSALVIIDFKKAIENGFITLSTEAAEAYGNLNE